jgi:hypothetical protein
MSSLRGCFFAFGLSERPIPRYTILRGRTKSPRNRPVNHQLHVDVIFRQIEKVTPIKHRIKLPLHHPDKWILMPVAEKRAVAEVMTKKVTVGKDDITITLSFTPPSLKTDIQGNASMRVRGFAKFTLMPPK